MSDDDDWFERALREDDEAADDGSTADSSGASADPASTSDRDDAGSDVGRTTGDEDSAGFGDGDGVASADDARPGSTGGAESVSEGSGIGETGGLGDAEEFGESSDAAFGSSDDGDGDASAGGFADADPYDADGEDLGGEDLFEEDFASAFENAPGGGASSAGGTEPSGGAGPSGETPGDGPAAGFGGGGGEFGMGADDDFAGGFGDSGESFDDEEFESSIPRIDVGIEGLDNMIQGGVPERSLITTIGSAGTGKTTFGLQFLHEALQQGENAVFITLEESHERIVSTATEKGWNFDEYVEEGSLAVVDLDPIEMANSLTSIRNDLPRLVEEFGATRLVLDSVSLLEMMYDDQATRRNEVYDFTKSLKQAGVTTMLTSEASEDTPYASRHGIIEYLVDAVFVLRYIRSSDDFRETRLAVEIQKIRDANHSREIKPYSITNEGISVYRQANIF